MGERIADSELEWHAKQAGVIGSLARALAAERAALRELRGLVRYSLDEQRQGESAMDAVNRRMDALSSLKAALVGWPEGAPDDQRG